MTVGFYLDMTRCIGCRACQVVCKDKNRLEVGTLYREAHTYTVGRFPEVQGVIQDQGKCIGCRMCVMSCPYGHPKFFPEQGVSGKCDGCYGLRQSGGESACVAGCPNRALKFGDVDELRAEFGGDLDEGRIAVLPSPEETRPNILIKTKECAFDEGYREVNW